jgi:hypothetical protein
MIEGIPAGVVNGRGAGDRHHGRCDMKASNATTARGHFLNRFIKDPGSLRLSWVERGGLPDNDRGALSATSVTAESYFQRVSQFVKKGRVTNVRQEIQPKQHSSQKRKGRSERHSRGC